MKILMLRAIRPVLRIALGSIFLWAAIAKAVDIQKFMEEVVRYRIVPDAMVPVLAAGLIGIEFAASILMLIGIRVHMAAGAMAFLLAIFSIALSQALLRHLDLTCGCFGGEEPASWWTVGRDAVILAACLVFLKPGLAGLREKPRRQFIKC